MSLRLSSRRLPQGRDCASLRKWGMVFLTAGVIGTGIIQNALLNMNSLTGDELLAAMDGNPTFEELEEMTEAKKRRSREENEERRRQEQLRLRREQEQAEAVKAEAETAEAAAEEENGTEAEPPKADTPESEAPEDK